MRPLVTLLLSFFLALPATGDLSSLCAGQAGSEETAHACCHQQAPDCNSGAITAAYCCQSQVPVAPVPASQALPPAPYAAGAFWSPDLLVPEFATFAFPLLCPVFSVPDTRPSALYQLHHSYRI